MLKYPNCSALLIEYVEKELAPLLRSNRKFREDSELNGWEEQVEYFNGERENTEARYVNLVYWFAYWTQYLVDDYPQLMQILQNEVAKKNSVPVAYHPNEKSTFYFMYNKRQVDLTFTVFVIRAMLLKARPLVASSLSAHVDMRLLDWMEDILGMFPMSEADKSRTPVYVNMEKVGMEGVITNTGWPYVPDQTVAELLTKTWGVRWSTYRLAYGVQNGILAAPTELEWVTPALSANYNPSLKDLFRGKSLKEGENYYLLISRLETERSENIWIRKARERYSALYPPVARSPSVSATSPREREGSLPTAVGRGGRVRHPSDVRKQNLSELLDTLKTSLEF